MPTTTTPQPLGFPGCARCPLLSSGDPLTCARCVAASSTLGRNQCPVCSHPLSAGDSCGNPVCSWDDRDLTKVSAACRRTGPIERVLKRFKYEGETGWAPILGRVVVGWLEDTYDDVGDFDLIVVNPTHPSRQPVRHMELILDAARREDPLDLWPFDDPSDPAIVKREETASATAYGTTWRNKKTAADELWWALEVVHPERVRDARVLVVDDATTTLLQLNVVAGVLRRAGAEEVEGLVIARSVR